MLVGLSGTGKTTIGHLLKSNFSSYEFVDTDELIVKQENRSINEIFETDGENKFRDLETAVTKEISKKNDQIISTGGGIILREENINALRQNGIIFYLKTSPDVIIKRLEGDDSRPLLKTKDIKNKLYSMLKVRENLYKKADFTIVTDDLTQKQVADEIERIYYERN